MTRLLTVPQAADYLGVPKETLYRLIREGRGPVVHPDCKSPLRVSLANLDRWAEKVAS